MDPKQIPLSLYVHIPWCVRKCPYCDFNSHESAKGFDESRYIQALLKDLDTEALLTSDRALESVFIGGGTPSLFSGEGIQRLMDSIGEMFTLADGAELSLEANPGAVDTKEFTGYRRAGVNRLSLGVQSLDDEKLSAIGRIHTVEEAVKAYRIARDAGFDNINLDLMYALPGQSLNSAMEDLEKAVKLDPEHLSWYQLTLEPNTAFHHSPPANMPTDDTAWEIQEKGQALLREYGFEQYEISGYAKPGFQCKHNNNYWLFGDYIGIGAGAHGKLTDSDGVVHRRRKEKHPDTYLKDAESNSFLSGISELQDDDLILEFMMNVLRLNDGVPRELFAERTGLNAQAIAPRLHLLQERGVLIDGDERIQATALGRRYLNDVLAVFA